MQPPVQRRRCHSQQEILASIMSFWLPYIAARRARLSSTVHSFSWISINLVNFLCTHITSSAVEWAHETSESVAYYRSICARVYEEDFYCDNEIYSLFSPSFLFSAVALQWRSFVVAQINSHHQLASASIVITILHCLMHCTRENMDKTSRELY